jgi:hypothetical protein
MRKSFSIYISDTSLPNVTVNNQLMLNEAPAADNCGLRRRNPFGLETPVKITYRRLLQRYAIATEASTI